MRITATLFLLLAMSLPGFAHHDRDDRDHHRSYRHRRIVVEDCGPRVYVQRRHSPYVYLPPRMGHHRRHWREYRHPGAYLPPPPVVIRPHGSIWIGF